MSGTPNQSPRSTSLKLGLLENSHAFLAEAVECALAARSDVRKWQFAILHLCQSLELSIKARLAMIHPVLVFEDIDKRKHTASLTQALQRLQAPEIGAMPISSQEIEKIERFVQLRNKITHADFELTEQYAEAKFFEIFAFLALFQALRLSTEIENIIEAKKFIELLAIKKAMDELCLKALARIKEENIEEAMVWGCPNCDSDTFVTQDAIDTCYTCRHQESVVQCPRCSVPHFEHELESVEDAFDTDYDEGIVIVHNKWGYGELGPVCEDCGSQVREDIQRQREQSYYEDRQREYYERDHR